MKIVKVNNPKEGFEICKTLIYQHLTQSSVLFLSGGSTPKTLYQLLAKEKKLKAGAVAMVDERYGEKFYIDSNELMIKNTQLLSALDELNIKFYPILQNKGLEDTAKDYDETVRYLFNHFQKSMAILGVGTDGHTAGIPAIEKISDAILNDKTSLVSFYNANKTVYKKRITLSFAALRQFDKIIVLAFGKEKQIALKRMFEEGFVTKVPARFLMKELSKVTVLITDQSVYFR